MKHWSIQKMRWTYSLMTERPELWVSASGVGLGLWLTELISRWTLGMSQPWFVIPMGASAVLLFAVPASPLAQPWPLMGGNVLSALCGTACHMALGSQPEAIALAGGLAVALMFACRCIHPPGGAMALTAVMGGPAVSALGWSFAWLPVFLNSAVLLLLALVFNRLAGRRYPHHPAPAAGTHATTDLLPSQRGGVLAQDVDAALAGYGELLDIDRGDLQEILTRATLQAQRRTMGQLRCRDIMSRDLVTIELNASVDEAWDKLAQHRIKTLPVVDANGTLQGIISVPDFFIDRHNPKMQAVPRMQNAATVAEIMTRPAISTHADQLLSDLILMLSDGGLHHIPVVDDDHRLVGMVTQSDMVGAMIHHVMKNSN